MELLVFASIDVDEYPEVFEWLIENIHPTYLDYELEEHLYSVDIIHDCMNENQVDAPDYVKHFIREVMRTDERTAYFRFVK